MKIIECQRCRSTEFKRDTGFSICLFCRAKFVHEVGDTPVPETMISVSGDVLDLLNRCKQDPRNSRKFANLILDIDPTNQEALKYL